MAQPGNAQGRSWWPQASACLGYVSIKAHGFLWLGSLLGVIQLQAVILLLRLQQDKIILSIWTLKTLLWKTWGRAGEQIWRDCVGVGCVVKGPQSELRWLSVTARGVPGCLDREVCLITYANKYTTLIYIFISSWIFVLALSELF